MAKKAEKIAQEARIAVEKWRQYFRYNIDQYHKMHDFVLGRQWSEDEEDLLKSFKKVPLQFNKLATLVNTLLGEQQQNTPQLEVVPLSNCDEETAQIRQIVVKDLMLSNDAKLVYQIAASQAFVGGFGAYVIDTDYIHDKSFDQDIVYRYFKDSTCCYWDVSAETVAKTDGMRCGYISRMSRKKFREIYGKKVEEQIGKTHSMTASKEEVALATQSSILTSAFTFEWADEEAITIIHDYVRTFEKETLYKLSNGETLDQEQMDELIESSMRVAEQIAEQEQQALEMQMMQAMQPQSASPDIQQGMQPDMNTMQTPMQQDMGMQMGGDIVPQPLISGANQVPEEDIETQEFETEPEIMTLYYEGEPVRIEDKRDTKRSKIIHRLIAGDYILDESEFPSEDLPLIFVDQNSYFDKTGKQICRPFVLDAIDAQRYINYLGTQSAYILKVTRFDQFIGSKKNIQGLDTQTIWKDPSAYQGMLFYDESPSGAKPEQLRPPEMSQSLTQQYQRAIEDLYTSTGLYPTRLGQEGNEVSGAAIDARTRQGSYTTYVAFNAINRAITAGGAVVNQMVPRVYDTERVMNLMTPDKGRQNIIVNHQVDEYGEIIKNDIRKGSFEVRLQAGPSYEGQKAQALESLNLVLQANPQLLNLFADLYAENLPLVNTIEIKNRLKTIVPPEILEAGKTGQMPEQAQQPNPQDQAIMADMKMKEEQIQIKKAELELKIQQAQADMEIKQMEMEIRQLEAAAQLEEQKLRFLAETQRTHSDNAIAHADNLTKLLTQKME